MDTVLEGKDASDDWCRLRSLMASRLCDLTEKLKWMEAAERSILNLPTMDAIPLRKGRTIAYCLEHGGAALFTSVDPASETLNTSLASTLAREGVVLVRLPLENGLLPAKQTPCKR